MPKALESGFFLPFPESLSESFARVGREAGARRRGRRHGAPFAQSFLAEPAYFHARLIAFDTKDEALRFEVNLSYDPAAAVAQIAELAGFLDWCITHLRELGELDDAPELAARLVQIDRESSLFEALSLNRSTDMKGASEAVQKGRFVSQNSMERDALAKARTTLSAMRTTHALFRHTIDALKPMVDHRFQRRLSSGQMDPALGLLLAELSAARRVQESLNAFTDRFIRYYYEGLLGAAASTGGREEVLLRMAPSGRMARLPSGTRVVATSQDAQPVAFLTRDAATISPVQLREMATLAYRQDRRISFGAEFGWVSSVTSSRTAGDDGAVAFPMGVHSLFAPPGGESVSMGVDIGSPMFEMEAGARRIDIRFVLGRNAALPAIEDAHGAASRDQSLIQIEQALGADPDIAGLLMRRFTPARLKEAAKEVLEHMERESLPLTSSSFYRAALALMPVLKDRAEEAARLRVVLDRVLLLSLFEGVPLPAGAFRKVLGERVSDCIDALGVVTGAAQAETLPIYRDDFGSLALRALVGQHRNDLAYTAGDLFQKLLSDAFEIWFETSEGRLDAGVTQVLPVEEGSPEPGFRLRLKVPANAPAINAPKGREAPVLSIRNNSLARLCPISLLEPYRFERLDIEVAAEEMAMPFAWSDIGPVATDSAFMPFGVRPGNGAKFIAAHPELANKPVTHVAAEIEWGRMPKGFDGFSSHYLDYYNRPKAPDPEISLDYLGGDGWKPVGKRTAKMLEARLSSGRLSNIWRLEGMLPGQAQRSSRTVTAKDFQQRDRLPGGAIALTLTVGEQGFLAEQYPLSLSDAMRPRLNPFHTRYIPPEPFVPEIAKLTVSYRAKSTMMPTTPIGAADREFIDRAGVFGHLRLFPTNASRQVSLFPPRYGYGQVYFRLDQLPPGGRVSLALRMSEAGHLRLIPKANPIRWFYLSDFGWMPLPDTAVVSDSTAGLMRSGVVTLQLPEDISREPLDMGAPGPWLMAAATEPSLATFPALDKATTNGVWAQRSDETRGVDAPIEAPSWAFDPPQSSAGQVTALVPPHEAQRAEDRDAFFARVAERLRHRSRAVTPWDVERLVLEAFPEVALVKCLPHMSQSSAAPAPGVFTVVVLRKLRGAATGVPQLFDAAKLQAIRDFLRNKTSRFADIQVVNPAFDVLQVRAEIRVSHSEIGGDATQRLNDELTRYLSVWSAPPELNRFDWRLNLDRLYAHIAGLPFVAAVSDYSVLSLSRDDGRLHQLVDSALTRTGHRTEATLLPSKPWALPLSSRNHALRLQTLDGQDRAEPSGIGQLQVGDMLIVGQRTAP